MTDVDLLIQNAQLRDEMEPYLDESVYLVDLDQMSVRHENEFLQSILAWEKAPILPICQWFDPVLKLPFHLDLSDSELKDHLHQVIGRLFEKNIWLIHTEHLSDRQLYCLIARDILPSEEKKIELPSKCLKWRCLDIEQDEESWLRYYATDEERDVWFEETGLRLPPKQMLPFPRRLPQHSS
ncbi:MAG: hypothetical protein AAF939_18205 [Planctomycetota bacterium]